MIVTTEKSTAGLSPCPHGGARNVGGEGGCNDLFQEVVGREFSRPELFQVHRLTVDAYALQHPDRYMKSAKSAVAHLTGMCWAMEGVGANGLGFLGLSSCAGPTLGGGSESEESIPKGPPVTSFVSL
jgi:hypothetical protein